MNKKIKINKNKGIVFWVTGLSGVGKTTISKKLQPLLNKKFGKTVLINGDNLRLIFELKNYDINSRKKYVKQYSKICQFLTNQNINVIMSVVGLFHNIHTWNRKNLSNYIEIYIKSNFTKIKKFDSRGVYNRKKVVGIDINKETPKKPHIVIFNDFIKDQKFYAKQIFDKLDKILN